MPSIFRAFVMLLLAMPAFCASENSNIPVAVPPHEYLIALTFDDGPHPAFTEKIIAALAKERVPATFFVVGSRAAKYPFLIERLSGAGHEVAVHTYTHRNLCGLKDAEIEKELIDTQQLVKGITGQMPLFYRPPGGQYDDRVAKAAEKCGMAMVLWTVFTNDHAVDDPSAIIEKVKLQAADGGIILLHSGRPATLAALPGIIKELRNRSYRFVTVSGLDQWPVTSDQ